MNVNELIEELHIYKDIGYGWVPVRSDRNEEIEICISHDGPRIILISKDGD